MLSIPSLGAAVAIAFSMTESISRFQTIPIQRALQYGLLIGLLMVMLVQRTVAFQLRVRSLPHVYFMTQLILSAGALLVSMKNNNPAIYIATDIAYAAFEFLIFSVGFSYWRRADAGSIYRGIHGAFFVNAILASVLLILGLPIPAPVNVLLITALFSAAVHEKGLIRVKSLALSGLPLLADFANLNRASLMALFVAFMLAALVTRKGSVVRVVRVLALLLLVAAGTVAVLFSGLLSGTRLSGRFDQIEAVVNGGSIRNQVSLYERIYEAREVVHETFDSVPEILVGNGPGATLNLSEAPDQAVRKAALLGGGKVHNVHILPFAVLFRSGVIGLMNLGLLLFWLADATWLCFASAGSKSSQGSDSMRIARIAICYLIAMFVYALPAASAFLDDPLTPALASLAVVSLMSLRARRVASRSHVGERVLV